MQMKNIRYVRILRPCDVNIPMTWQSVRDRPAKEMPPIEYRHLQAYMREKIGASQTRYVRKYNTSQQYVSWMIKGKTSLPFRSRQPAPDVTEGQKSRPKTKMDEFEKRSHEGHWKTLVMKDKNAHYFFFK